MAEKKKIAVVMEASDTSVGGGSVSFDFSSFQNNLGASAPAGGTAPPHRATEDDSGSYTTAYQARKSSIADGLTSEQLVVEHRKSIANVAGVDSAALGGLTLSRRQSMSHEEYGEEINQSAYESLAPYTFDAKQ